MTTLPSTAAAPAAKPSAATALLPGAAPGSGAGTAGLFDFGALLLAVLGGVPPLAADAGTHEDADGRPDEATHDGPADGGATQNAAAAAAGALAATAQAVPAAVPVASAEGKGAAAAKSAVPVVVAAVPSPAGATAGRTAAVAAEPSDGAATPKTVPPPSAVPSTSEGGTPGSRAADVVVEAGIGAVHSAPSDLPSKTTPASVVPDAGLDAATPPPADGAAVLHASEHAKADAPASTSAGERIVTATAAGGPEAPVLQAAHAGSQRDASSGGRHEGSEPPPAPAEAAPPAPMSGAFQVPVRDAAHVEAPRLEAPPPRAFEPPDPVHVPAARNEMRLEVGADDLGKVEVRVVVHADSVHATLLAGQDNTREALAHHRASLEEALGRAQLRLDGFTVGAGPNDGRERHERFDRSGLPTATTAGTPLGLAATTPAPVEALPAKGLSLRA